HGKGSFKRLGRPTYSVQAPELQEGQRSALVKVLKSRDRVTSLRGVLPVSKPAVLNEINQATDEPMALYSAKNINKLLKEPRLLQQEGLLVIDEAQKLGAKDMADVFQLVDRLEARLVLIAPRRKNDPSEPLQIIEDNGVKTVDILQEMNRPLTRIVDPKLAERFRHYLKFVKPIRQAEPSHEPQPHFPEPSR
ncbi:MAG: hypothetical protein KDB27_02515, partial [Planctomycetales bacterium]|nr:hypothetical protein [Planctomycetales bacterium]